MDTSGRTNGARARVGAAGDRPSGGRRATRALAGVLVVAGAVCAAAVVAVLAGAGREVVHLVSAAAELGGDSWLTHCLHCTGESPSAGAAGAGGGGGAGGPAGAPSGGAPDGCEGVLSEKESVGQAPSEEELQGRNAIETILTAIGRKIGVGHALMGASAAQTSAKGILTVKCARRIENRSHAGRQAMEAIEESRQDERGLNVGE